MVSYQYQSRRELITPIALNYGRSCCIFGHYSQTDNTAELVMHDTRVSDGGVVSILDTSQHEFGGVTWLPYYNILTIGNKPY